MAGWLRWIKWTVVSNGTATDAYEIGATEAGDAF